MAEEKLSIMTNELHDDHMKSIYTEKNWSDIAPLSREVREMIEKKYQKPTLIQYLTIGETIEFIQPVITVKCRNGGGKTLTFVIPALEFAFQNRMKSTSKQQQSTSEKKGLATTTGTNVYCPTSIIVVTTQPLAKQIGDVINDLKPGGVSCEILYQDQEIKLEGQILISTPDLLLRYLVKEKTIQFDNLVHFAFDEADNMMSMFQNQISTLLSMMKGRDVVVQLISATLSEINQQIIFEAYKFDEYTQEEEVIYSIELPWKLKGVTQFYQEINCTRKDDLFQQKFDICKQLINRVIEYNSENPEQSSQVIIFFKKISEIQLFEDYISNENIKWNYTSCANKKVRNSNIENFRRGNNDVMLASGVMSRGIDIRKVGLVINFNLPVEHQSNKFDKDSYLHSIGRTGRFADLGLSLTLVDKASDTATLISDVKNYFECDIHPYNIDKAMSELKNVMINNSKHERVQ